MYSFILIIVFVSGSYGIPTTLTQEFNTEKSCMAAGTSIVERSVEKNVSVRAWGCYSKGEKK